MRLRLSRTAALSAALLFSATASAEEWFDAYGSGLKALKQGKAALAVESFERSIGLRPEPGEALITYGTNRLDKYYPYLRLAEAQLLAGNLDAAREALKRSEVRGKEPGAERGRLAQLVEVAQSARVADAAPTPTIAVASPTPASFVAPAPVLAPSTPPAPGAPVSSPPPSDQSETKPPQRVETARSEKPTSKAASTAAPPSGVPASVPSPTLGPLPVGRILEPVKDAAPASGASPGYIALGMLVLSGLGVAAWAFQARARAAKFRREATPFGEIETRAIAGFVGGLPGGAGELFGDYRLLEPLGKGGMAAVFKAERNGETQALKRPLAAFLADPEFLERFLREAEIGRTLHHPNVVRIHERGEVAGVPYFTMELVKGRTLEDIIRERGALEPKQAAKIVAQVAEALDYAHLKGVIHRDLKPSNIMVTDDGVVKVMDYGIARARRFEGLTIAGVFLGTPEYAAPETAQGLPIDARSDLYSLGVVFYEMVTGRKPFVGDTPFVTLQKQCTESPSLPSVIVPGTPRPLEAIILRLLSKEPASRYGGAEELLIELREYLNRAV